jgi:NADH dehydrogenase FAD-containing subunit
MTPTVIVVGGGYGGIVVAKALDEVADVVLVEPRDAFVHNVAALRAAVDPEWADRLFIPYDGLLARGRLVRDRAARVALDGGRVTVTVAAGETLAGDYAVLATGSSYPFPAKIAEADGRERLRQAHEELTKADRVLLVGAGPVGLEFAGEIKAVWPEKKVILVDRAADLMPGFPEEFRAELGGQLGRLGVEVRLGVDVRLGAAMGDLPEPGRYAPFAEADIWFPCYGGAPASDYLAGDLAAARRADGLVEVTPELRVRGTGNVFAVGDLTALPELKMARLAGMHAEVVAANLRTLIGGGAELSTYEPQPAAIVLPLGPRGGVTYAPEMGVLGAGPTAEIKSGFYLEHYRTLLGA